MAYVTQARIETALPPQHLRDALDDDGDGQADSGILEEIIASASQAVDGFLAGLFAVPFADPAPAAAAEAAFVFALERIYDRRQAGERNPWRSQADGWRERLERMGKGDLPLDAGVTGVVATPGAAVTENAAHNETLR